MKYVHFIGIDVSKLSFDVFIHGTALHKQFSNDREGFGAFLKWLKSTLKKVKLPDLMICFEHTGLYSLTLSMYLEEIKCPYFMISALQIKRSLGITRGKSDKIDARRIAEYAYLHRETLSPTLLPSKAIFKLQPLMTLRNRLVRHRAGYKATRTEQKRFLPENELSELFDAYSVMISTLDVEIRKVEQVIKSIIQNDEELNKTFKLITGIKGVGFLVGTYLIMFTHNFTRFDSWRQFACYAGIAPFEHQSGSSIRGKTKVSPIANKLIKKLLHLSALSAAHKDKELGCYFKKRVEQGKSKMSTLNIIRNKVLARIFAVAKRKTEYVDFMKYVA